jgi:2,3-dihydroxybenzoate-AMP ligase
MWPSMYDDWISYWAKRSPANVAVVVPRGAIRYAEFDTQINKVAARLSTLGLTDGARVSVSVADEHLHWLVLLALDRLGIPSISTPQLTDEILSVLQPVLMLTDGEPPAEMAGRTVTVSKEWFEEAMRLPPVARPAKRGNPDEIVRFFASSGTTGKPKLLALTRGQVAVRVHSQRLSFGAGAGSRGCVLVGPGTGGGFVYTLAFWSTGASVVLNLTSTRSHTEALRITRPTHLFIAVGTLLALVRGPGAMTEPMPSMEVYIVGSALPRSLVAEARRRLSPNLSVKYGATEAPGVAIGTGALLEEHNGTAGYVLPTVEIEAVDMVGRVLPPGATGELRIRVAGMATGYLGEETGGDGPSALRDGWFYPGDLGSVSADGVVMVAGRVTEILNIGGAKFQPAAIEEVVLGCTGIRDAAAFSVPDEHGIEIPWVAVVRGDAYKPGELVARVRARWPGLTGLKVAVTREIPRNQMGKIDRLQLRQHGVTWRAATTRA